MKPSILDLQEDKRQTVENRFWSKVDKTNSCWLWKAAKYRNGYGRFGVTFGPYNSPILRAHRISFELSKGRIPEDKQPDHLCRNRACVNPSHIELVTQRENTLRGNGTGAQNARKTHCKNGHLLTGDNLVTNRLKKGQRVCRICLNSWQRKSRLEQKSK